ncbi:hypothetical protein KCP69_26160 [Salmonella enterica subsp. enterica]|nr:hypothetical protein KCP69_26160 [Salmonella enterica subsp. enterica]
MLELAAVVLIINGYTKVTGGKRLFTLSVAVDSPGNVADDCHLCTRAWGR